MSIEITNPDTAKLYVRLSAAQTRKRLKGRGFGVKRVEATGNHQSVIVHRATEGHLRDLESLFCDVMLPASEDDEPESPGGEGLAT